MRKLLLSMFAIAFAAGSASAAVGDTFVFDQISYEVTGDATVEVSSVPSSITEALTIPQTVTDAASAEYTVTGVGYKAFYYTKMPTVVLPPTITYIDEQGFYNCELSSIELPAAVRTIGNYAFGYTKLTSIVIPEGVETLGNSAFNRCDKLTSITLPSTLRSVGSSCFYKCAFTSIVLPEGFETIGKTAFLNSALETVTLPSTLRTIGDGAFNACKLTAITLPEGLKTIGVEAFFKTPITSMVIPASVETIGAGAFDGTDIAAFEVAEGSTSFLAVDGNLFTADKSIFVAFPPKSTVTELTLPDATIGIGGSAFANSGIQKVTVGNKFRAIDGFAFCLSKLSSFNFPESLVFIGEQAFAGTNLTSVVLPSNLPQIQTAAFSGCKALSEVTLPASVNYIDIRAFSNCTSLATINCLGATPPVLEDWYEADEDPFFNIVASAVVNVPSNALETYRKDNGWKSAFSSEQFVGSLPAVLVPTETTPAGGTAVSSFDGVVFKFAGAVSVVVSDPAISVVEGKLVAGTPIGTNVSVDAWMAVKEGSDGVKIFPCDYDLYLYPFNMELGKKYYVTIPAGIIKGADGSLNEKILLEYDGSWEAPKIVLESVTPANDASITTLTTLDFKFAETTSLVTYKLSDIKVIKGSLVDGVPTGDVIPVGQWLAVNGTTSGTTLSIFAADEYDGFTEPINLEAGADYYVVLPAGLFRHGSSYNTVSEQIILHYSNEVSGVEVVSGDAADVPSEYYTIDGRRVAVMEPGHLYIVRQGTKVTKILAK